MNVKAVLAALILTAHHALSQGFAGLGTEADGFAVPAPNPEFSFPADHGPHPEYRIEWWYLTATLSGADGQDYGVQWTLFRSALRPESAQNWDAAQLWMGHAGLTTSDAHYHAERLARGGIGQAGVTSEPFEAWIDDWSMISTASAGNDALSALSLTARGADFAYDLSLTATGPLIFQGDGGYSVKSADGQASYYYSQPFYEASGELTLPGGPVAVTGTAWLDREWSSQPLSEDQNGWDWFSLQFADGARLMGFGLRSATRPVYTSATWITPDGRATPYPDGALRLTSLNTTSVAGREVPTEWRVELPARGVDIETQPVNAQSWMATSFPYWEGPIRFSGSHQGIGYLEMTGYE
ncbi:iron ABC transporter permease [Roseobacter sp. HKCCD9010]|uniref:lipocalin-like domain-containing protein n=1 Tax=unclassified Roseobacter TaxID=196798 RepID=UPI0014923045|nr:MULTISPECIES: lipocalin-like domain-containing protein [unclassified Roseobacter]MBF9048399.1 iron ABC transporter permease [Rhodobacterales bacterium HKCCD4356]NNV10398.1 iron ABC transporter permease [Roseobacter sp. HKCCD7357]NNV14583.1 iron ABC transporter permease [Roseobacter sp. HKCCD8768]NNV24042.1 iron ABC transporter permease [Roseobacter sp. HKCCD8192]NNV28299.1 iron ABC transporter permease [Roseobacter sp. HKCCD9061]